MAFPRLSRAARLFDDGAMGVFMALLALLPAAEMVARTLFHTGIPDSPTLTGQLVVAVGLLAGVIAAREREHLAIGLVGLSARRGLRMGLGLLTAFLSSALLTVFAVASASFVLLSLMPPRPAGLLPEGIAAWLMPVAYAAMALRLGVYVDDSGGRHRLPLLGLLAGLLLSAPAFAHLLGALLAPPTTTHLAGAFAAPGWAQDLSLFVTSIYAAAGPAFVVFLVLAAFAGLPLFLVIAGAALFLVTGLGGELEVVPNQFYTELTLSSLPAIPLFTLAGFILSESRAGERLLAVFRALFGFLPGGVIVATVAVCAFFTTFTGASGVTILALGGLLSKILLDAKYPPAFAYGLLTAVGSIGILFPPSLPIILVGVASQTSVLKMFAGGIVPGLVLVAAMAGFGIVSALRNKVALEPFDAKAALRSLPPAAGEILLPFLLVAGYFSGLLTIVETAAVSAIYAFVLEVFVTRDIALRDAGRVVAKAAPVIGGILAILASSQALSYLIVDAEIPQALTAWVSGIVASPLLFILLLDLALIVAGCFMDIYSAIIVLVPLIVPLGEAYHIDPVRLGIIFVATMELGFLTPPVGLNLFLASYRFRRPFLTVSRDVLPFLLVQFLVVLGVSFVPEATTWLASFF